MGHRARDFASHLGRRYDIRISYRSWGRVSSALKFVRFLFWNRPALTYVFDMASSGTVAGIVFKIIARNRLIIDTGDEISALARSMGRGRVGLCLTDYLEKISFRFSDCIVVRGTFHRDLLAKRNVRAELIHDGVNAEVFQARDVSALRAQLGLQDVLTVGIVGASIWSEKLKMCYGWELVETMRLLKDKPVHGIFVGDGSGIAHLKAKCREYGIENKMLFLGFVPFDRLPDYLSLMDVCLSTQTNDVVGNVRTTGKLPLYLASGRYILASRVGEAALVLPEEMLVDYDGIKDLNYPSKLTLRIGRLLQHRDAVSLSTSSVKIARERFDYLVLSRRLASVIDRTSGRLPFRR
jgi:glycosyltransferase involved in cell wall biosynthesis